MDNNLQELLQICEQEKLHLSGAIQSFGALLVVDKQSLLITHASANLEELTGINPKEALGIEIACLPHEIERYLDEKKSIGASEHHYNFLHHNGKMVDMLINFGESSYIIELELTARAFVKSIPLNSMELELLNIPTSEDAMQTYMHTLVDAISLVSGFDRVMLYRFHDDWSGEVVAEATSCEIGSYLGLRFPASDIPQIARNLYMINPSRIIPDATASSIPIIGVDKNPPDLTYSDTRSVSPVHLEYLSNMGVKASFSVPIKVAGSLYGLIACHNLVPHHIGAEQRGMCVKIAKSFSIGVAAYNASRRLNMIDGCERRINELLESITKGSDFLEGVCENGKKMLDFLHADGFVTVLDGDVFSIGDTPSDKNLEMLDRWFDKEVEDTLYLTDTMDGILRLDTKSICEDGICGLVAMKIGRGGARFYWFRNEELKEIAWAGNPNKPVMEKEDAVMLSPRRSFEKYTEIKRGHSKAWSNEDKLNATRFRNSVTGWF